jgi:hypothetical protein
LDNFLKILRNLHVIHARSSGTGNLIFDHGIYENSFVKLLDDVKLSSFYGSEVGFFVSAINNLIEPK